jgi:hypothetical protein
MNHLSQNNWPWERDLKIGATESEVIMLTPTA